MHKVYIGVGSNKDAERHLKSASQRLKTLCSNFSLSPIYKSKAHGFNGDDFYNAIFCCDTELSFDDFNALLKQIELENGRKKPASEFGVSLDLDILLFGDQCSKDKRVPRIDIYRYDYVLKPLVDLAPQLVLPDTQKTVLALWNEMRDSFDANALHKVELSL